MIRSQSTHRARRSGFGTALGAGLLALVLSSCSAGQITQTADQRPAIQGVNVASGDVHIVDAFIVAPPISDIEGTYEPGDIAEVSMLVVNDNALMADEVIRIEIDGEEAEFSVDGSDAEVPPRGSLFFDDEGEGSISFEVQELLYPAMYLPAVVTMAEAGEISFNLPVATAMTEVPRDPDDNFELHPIEGEH